jgi:hypothetical protein
VFQAITANTEPSNESHAYNNVTNLGNSQQGEGALRVSIKTESDQEPEKRSHVQQAPAVLPSDVMDSRGDLILVVKASGPIVPQPVAFRVCSRSLARSSAVLDAWLFEENKPLPEGWTLTFRNAYPDALRIVLQAVHGKFEAIPSTLDVPLLARVAQLCDRYGLLGLLKSYWDPWIKHIEGRSSPWSCLPTVLRIFWILGYESQFEQALRTLIIDLHCGPRRLNGWQRLCQDQHLKAIGIACECLSDEQDHSLTLTTTV